jgi:hypothetical protein
MLEIDKRALAPVVLHGKEIEERDARVGILQTLVQSRVLPNWLAKDLLQGEQKTDKLLSRR